MEGLTAAAKAEAERVIASLPERVASLDALGQLVVRQQHPPPRSIDFAGAD